MDDYELEAEYDDERFFEDKYNDDFDALNDFEDGASVKSPPLSSAKTANIIKTGNGVKEESFKKLTSNWSFAVDASEEEHLGGKRDPEPKRQKIQEDSDDELEEQQHLPYDTLVTELPGCQKSTKKYVYQMPQFGKDCLTVTDTEGRRVYLPIRDVREKEKAEAKPQVNKHNLLSTPIEDLIQTVENKRHSELMEKVNNIKNLISSNVDDEITGRGETADIEMIDGEDPESSLWVEKYHPRRFTELLSDDGINRILLKWIKLWDQFVFGKSKKRVKTSSQEKVNQSEMNRKFGKRKQNYDYEEEMDLDHTGRPKYKIALLSGNPGLGKTTLAHIVAKHAGYNPVEMNASDDRSAELFKNKLETTTQMVSCMGDANKPNCLIIDEIDGAPVQAINILLQTIKDTEELTKKKKKSKQITVTRPIICICNDLYVPALKQLRQTALSLSVPQVAPSRLAQRLLEISRKQKMKADMGCLLALCDKSENDIRSCVNTLQFIYSKHGEMNASHLQDVSIGQKDFHKGLFFVLKSVFQLPKSSRRQFGFLQNVPRNGLAQNRLALSGVESEPGATQTSNSIRFHNILHLASSNSEFEKTAQGLFDNYLNVKSKDPHLDSVVNCMSWLQFGDRLETKIRSEQNYSLMKFYPFLPVAFHTMLASALPPRLTYSNSAIEFNTRFSRLRQIWETVACDIRPVVKRNVGNVSTILDLFPYIYEIIHPTLRPVNIQLYSTAEKEQLSNLVSTMISYNLSYHQERNSDGQYTYVLQPNIGEIISFPNLPQHKQLSYAAKQLIQREIDLEKMRKVENSLQQMEIDTEKSGKGKNKAKQIRKPEKLQPVAVRHEKPKPTLDFFGREVVIPKDSGRAVEKKKSLINTKVWYKFNEGYSNAVRRKVRIQDFL